MVPAISIVMPFRDAAATLPEALAGVQAQSFGDWELLAVDDHSRDGSADCVRRVAAGPRSVVRSASAGTPASPTWRTSMSRFRRARSFRLPLGPVRLSFRRACIRSGVPSLGWEQGRRRRGCCPRRRGANRRRPGRGACRSSRRGCRRPRSWRRESRVPARPCLGRLPASRPERSRSSARRRSGLHRGRRRRARARPRSIASPGLGSFGPLVQAVSALPSLAMDGWVAFSACEEARQPYYSATCRAGESCATCKAMSVSGDEEDVFDAHRLDVAGETIGIETVREVVDSRGLGPIPVDRDRIGFPASDAVGVRISSP